VRCGAPILLERVVVRIATPVPPASACGRAIARFERNIFALTITNLEGVKN